ncbi:MAG: phenylacetaldoxime dehydratase family protein [Gulosibacter sp.]|uniref:phenylacetaldoxime dehydratase family protein n=1 Tax=Gulosibacter sp. TaxID=2817531 RepID=UPI003F8E9BC5
MEPSIPENLRTQRIEPLRMKEGHAPPYPSYSGRFGALNTGVVCALLGVQSPRPFSANAQVAIDEFWRACEGDNAPGAREVATHIDEHDFENRIILAYWNDPASFERWFSQNVDNIVIRNQSAERRGRWIEVIHSRPNDVETLYSSDTFPEGVSRVAEDGFSGEILEHGYWGSMRDRLPRSQTESLEPEGTPEHDVGDFSVRVKPHENFTIIRSGQDWSECDEQELTKYFTDVEPQLQSGMEFLVTNGEEVGCFSNRYMRSCDVDGNLMPQSFGLSFWRSLADLERWAESHPTHLRIFGAAMRFLRDNENTKLRLSHEVSVVPRAQQYFEYNSCHATTGMLGAVKVGASQ